MSRGRRLALVGLVIVIAIVGFVIASGSKDKPKTTATTSTTNGVTIKGSTPQNVPIQIVVKDGKPVGGVKKITVNKGDPVKFTVTSDVADEIHVHGYDFMKDVKKGGNVSFSFPAKIDGVFVIELESRGEQIASLEVNP
jgi:heme/copper-type cytochrome/quinol oxidase subunit 2